MQPELKSYLDEVAEVARRVDPERLEHLRWSVAVTAEHDRAVWVIGNGGFATVAEHFALGLTLNCLREGGRTTRATALSAGGSVLSSAVNDFGPERMFAAQLEALARPGDLLVALSGSGMSANVAAGLERGRTLGLRTVAIVGLEGVVSREAHFSVVLGTARNDVAEDVAIQLLHWVYGRFMDEKEEAVA